MYSIFPMERKQPPRVTTAFLFDYMRLHCTLWSVKRSKSSIKWHAKTSHLANMRLDIPLTAHSMWSQLFFLSGKPHTFATCKWCEEITDLRQLSNGHGQQPMVRFHMTQRPPPLITRKDGGATTIQAHGKVRSQECFFFLVGCVKFQLTTNGLKHSHKSFLDSFDLD